jgi:hypothetical protein
MLIEEICKSRCKVFRLWLWISLKLLQTGLDDLHDNTTQRGRGVYGMSFFKLAEYSNELFVQ